MKCYYHNEADAVSTCLRCHKALCKGCYDEGIDGHCRECAEAVRNESLSTESNQHYSYIKKSYIGLFIGLLIGLFMSSAVNYSKVTFSESGFALSLPLIYGYFGFSTYWGLHVMAKIVQPLTKSGFILIFSWPILLFLVIIAAFIGAYISIPMFIKHYRKYKQYQVATSAES